VLVYRINNVLISPPRLPVMGFAAAKAYKLRLFAAFSYTKVLTMDRILAI
jgi:hypothetical protein